MQHWNRDAINLVLESKRQLVETTNNQWQSESLQEGYLYLIKTALSQKLSPVPVLTQVAQTRNLSIRAEIH